MFSFLLQRTVLGLILVWSICVHFQCHTVVYSLKSQDSSSNESSLGEPSYSLSKRGEVKDESFGNVNHSRSLNISNERFPNHNTTVNAKSSVDDYFNSTVSQPVWMLNIKSGALQRTAYVALGIMSVIVIFFIVRGIRLRHKKSKSRKYGIITSTVSDMEMEPLDRDDEEEEDATLFDAQHKYALQ
ncbi:Membrane protein, partial [Stegodyphus mimosarum]